MDASVPSILHVTHEAAHHVGGIGTVLSGLLTSDAYRARVGRSILVGPLWDTQPLVDAHSRLGEHARVLYSAIDAIDERNSGDVYRPIEDRFGVRIVYGEKAILAPDEDDPPVPVEVALVDLSSMCIDRVNETKQMLYDAFGLESQRHEHDADFEQWVRLAAPALAIARALLTERELPCTVLSHEYMGMPAALLAVATGGRAFRTALHAHECATVRPLVEKHPAHDAAFYPAMHRAMARGQSIEAVFGSQDGNYRHELISRAHHLDVTLAVGEETANEMRFLSAQMGESIVRHCFNGVPHEHTSPQREHNSRDKVDRWLERAIGFMPDWLITHVTRPVVSKGIWRDVELLRQMAPMLEIRNEKCAYLLLTTGGRPRTPDEAAAMAREHNWPLEHREGWPDLIGPEVDLWNLLEPLRNESAISPLLVNQWGFDDEALGLSEPFGLSLADLRRAADVELGLSVYEPFGISPLEPLHGGSICVVTANSGCASVARAAAESLGVGLAPNVIVADFTAHDHNDPTNMTAEDLRKIEREILAGIAGDIIRRLPRTEEESDRLLRNGIALAERLQWDHVVESQFLPALCAQSEPIHERRAG